LRTIKIKRWKRGGWEETLDEVAEEGLLVLYISPGSKITFVCTPKDIKEMVFGYLLAQGFIRSPDEVQEYREEWDFSVGFPGEVVRVEVRLREEVHLPKIETIWSACAGERLELRGLSPFCPQPLFSPRDLLSLPTKIGDHVQGFRRTGAYHYAFLFDTSLNLVAIGEDIGRHNAADKAIGKAFLCGIPLRESILFTTGRITTEIAAKAVRAGIPLLVSQGAALLGAVHIARKYNLGLAGFLRGQRFNLYCGEAWFKA